MMCREQNYNTDRGNKFAGRSELDCRTEEPAARQSGRGERVTEPAQSNTKNETVSHKS